MGFLSRTYKSFRLYDLHLRRRLQLSHGEYIHIYIYIIINNNVIKNLHLSLYALHTNRYDNILFPDICANNRRRLTVSYYSTSEMQSRIDVFFCSKRLLMRNDNNNNYYYYRRRRRRRHYNNIVSHVL